MSETSETIQDKIRLAEIMGWEKKAIEYRGFSGRPVSREQWHRPDGITFGGIRLPDPFTNANDDYAVLEWVRKLREKDPHNDLAGDIFMLMNWLAEDYCIGDYANAALKVIGDA